MLFNAEVGELSSMYSLVLRKNEHGDIDGRLRIRAYQKALPAKKVYESFFDLSGQFQFSAVIYGPKNYEILHETVDDRFMNSRTSGCDVETSISRRVYCYGPNDNPTCVFYAVTTNKYHCYVDPTQEQEAISWINDDDGGGWYEYEESVEEYENKKIIDSLQGYPCAQDVLKQLPNINVEVQKILQNVFGLYDSVNVTFRADANLSRNIDGEAFIRNSSYDYYEGVVSINPYIMDSSAKDYIAATMIHEAIHAYIHYRRKRLDPATFESMFPCYVETANSLNHHEEMANNFVNIMANTLKSFNPNLSDVSAKALAWGGLHETTAWKFKTDTNYIKEINFKAKYYPADSIYNNYNFKRCQ